MTTLHIVPNDTSSGALRTALRSAGRDDDVVAFRDDLSCGPIRSDDPVERATWWSPFYDADESLQTFGSFWEHVVTARGRLIIWFARHSASELAFFHAIAEKLEGRPYDILDVTGLRLPFVTRDGKPALSPPKQAVAMISVDHLQALLGTERPIREDEACRYVRDWRKLKLENAHFRIVTEDGLASAPEDYFDSLILNQATKKCERLLWVIGSTLAYNSEPYFQTGDVMLWSRIIVLVEQGKLLADGDVRDRLECRIRLPA